MMWLSKRLRESAAGEETAADLGVTTIGGERAGVFTRGEVRDLALCTPGGLLWRPKSGDRVVVLKGGPGGEEAFVLGTEDETAADLADGELRLYADGASVTLRNDGTVSISGSLIINGEAYKPCTCDTAVGAETGGV